MTDSAFVILSEAKNLIFKICKIRSRTDMNMAVKFCLLLLLLLSLAIPCAAEEINVSLTIHEALRVGVTGIDRIQEPVTVGIPFPKGMLSEKNGVPQLALKGAEHYQFRTLASWPDSSVKWALVDFQTNVKSGSTNSNVIVIRGEGNSPGKLAEDKGEVIFINTGAMTVQIKKRSFNLFDSVIMDGKEIIAKGTSKGIVVIGEEGKEYLAVNDSKTKVSIEENGPVRAVIKAEGTHVRNSKRMLDYTVRMYFYKGKSRVRIFYTLRNASKQQFEHAYIHSLDLVTKIPIYEPDVVVAKHNGTIKEHLTGKTDEIVYYQAVSDFPQEYAGDAFYDKSPISPDYKREKERGFVQEGYWIKKCERELARGKRKEYPDLAFLDVSDREGKGATVGIRFAAGWWPKSLRANADGIIKVGLWPEENEIGYWIRFGSHNTFEMMYEFHDSTNDPIASMKKFQYPVVAKAPVEWYNLNVRGIYPLYNFVSFENEMKFIESKGWEYGNKARNRKEKMKIWRYHFWGWGGYWNQHDFARINLINFLRDTEKISRSGEYFLYSEARFGYNADWAIYHSDDYECTSCTKRGYGPERNRDKADLMGVTFDLEHPHWYGLALYYYMTGDERIKEAVFDWAEIAKVTFDVNKKRWLLGYPRFFGWGMYSLAALYDFTGDTSFMKIADRNFMQLLQNPQGDRRNLFIDWERGYVAGGSGSGWETDPCLKPGLMTGYIVFDGLYNYYLQMEEQNPLREKVADVLEGISEFMYREPYFEGEARNNFIIWLPYVYNLEDRSRSNHEYKTLRQAFYVNLVPYLLHGEERWLERMDKIIRTAALDAPDHLDHPGLQSMLYQRLHPKEYTLPPLPITDLSAEIKGRDVILSWTVPANAVRYQIKYSSKKLVESLEFDPDKRTYKYDLNEYTNWWAGENVSDEPMPGSPNIGQRYIIKGLKPGRYYFAIRSWDAFNNRSKISNLAEVIVK